MSFIVQLVFGTCLLTFCALVHVVVLATAIPIFPRIATFLAERVGSSLRSVAMLCFGIFVIVIAHTIEIWAWAAIFHAVEAFDTFPKSFYFATVTYTTLGYGDFVLDEGLRVFATFASVTGLLTFGISTALLIGLIVRLLPSLGSRNPGDDT